MISNTWASEVRKITLRRPNFCRIQGFNFIVKAAPRLQAVGTSSSDVTGALATLDGAENILSFVSEHKALSPSDLAVAVRKIVYEKKSIARQNDPRFDALIEAVQKCVPSCNPQELGRLATAMCNVYPMNEALLEAGQRIAEAAVAIGPSAVNPDALVYIVAGIARMKLKDDKFTEFARREVLANIGSVKPTKTPVLLQSFRLLGQFDQEFNNAITERMLEGVGQFNPVDVTASLMALANARLARGYLIAKLAELFFSAIRTFTLEQQLNVSLALAELRFLPENKMEAILDEAIPGLLSEAATPSDVVRAYRGGRVSKIPPPSNDGGYCMCHINIMSVLLRVGVLE
eukprot:GHVU01186993.1.p1 GENE.GHVU01186993.1~~GHVU01186993.1.p1  ORF type:complete len:346 (+),score=39.21 GHVU01186993.1:239-1276(+)